MFEQKYSVKLADGRIIDNLTLNGNNFVSDTEIRPEIFENNLREVIISDGFEEEIKHNMQLVGITKTDQNQWYFALIEIPEDVLRDQKLRSDVDYLAMMVDVDF